MITFIHRLFSKKPTAKRVLEKVDVIKPFEKKSASTRKKAKKNA